MLKDNEITYHQWESDTYQHRNGKNVSRKTYITKKATFAELVDHLCTLLVTYARHMFDARWQQKAFAFIKDKFKPTELVSVIDFSENYTTFFQDAVQASYWVNTQVTLFQIVVWYKYSCTESPTVREYIVFISNDLKHDYNAVHLFQTIAYGFVCNNRGVRINRIIEFSDGCASQFKSHGPFADISNSIQDFGVPIERHFFGSPHGKNDSDGVSGVIKSAVRRAVTTNRCTVSSADYIIPGYEIVGFACVWSCVHDHTCWSC